MLAYFWGIDTKIAEQDTNGLRDIRYYGTQWFILNILLFKCLKKSMCFSFLNFFRYNWCNLIKRHEVQSFLSLNIEKPENYVLRTTKIPIMYRNRSWNCNNRILLFLFHRAFHNGFSVSQTDRWPLIGRRNCFSFVVF